jgi:hypothetical protein
VSDQKQRGPKPQPRVRVSEELLGAIRTSGKPVWWLARVAGFPHTQSLSPLLHNEFPSTEINLKRLNALAQIVGISADRLFRGPS